MVKKIIYNPLFKILIAVILAILPVALFNDLADFFKLNTMIDCKDFDCTLPSSQFSSIYYTLCTLTGSIISLMVFLKMNQVYYKVEILKTTMLSKLPSFLKGLFLGLFLQFMVISVIYLYGGYTIISINSTINLFGPFLGFLGAAIIEEIFFRGILFAFVEKYLGTYWGLFISSILFGFVHLSNPGSSLYGAIAIMVEAGTLLGVAFIASRELYFPIGLHFGWNFAQSSLFGATVSGVSFSSSLINSKISGNSLITGGDFGPEQSIQAVAFCLLTAFGLYYFNRKNVKIIKPLK